MVSDEFGPLGRAEAEVLGLPALPLIPIPHPLAGTDTALVVAKAAGIATAVVDALTSDPATLAAREGARFRTLTERRLAGGAVCVDAVCALDPAVAGAARGDRA